MLNSNRLWRVLFALSIIGIALLQIVFLVFMPVIIPWPADIAVSHFSAWIGSIVLAAICLPVLVNSKARPAAIYLGLLFLLLLIVFHIPNQFLTTPDFLGSWANAFKIFALSACAFIVASSLPQVGEFTTGFEGVLPAGKYFLALTILIFGIEHFIYIGFVPSLVPKWIPFPVFWTYFTGVALIAAGLGILLNIQRQLAAKLLGIMLLIWVIILHIPRAWANPKGMHGNEIVSVFETLAFSSAAFILSNVPKKVVKTTAKTKGKAKKR